jgi:hypothetical protein
MRKVKFNLDCQLESDDSLEFLKNKGRYVKCMKVTLNSCSADLLKTFLSQTPNLEEFEFENKAPPKQPAAVRTCFCCGRRQFHLVPTKEQDWTRFTEQCWTPKPDSVELLGLKVLELELRDLDDFIRATKEVKSLEKLTVLIATPSDHRIMNEFIMQQDNLKELTLEVTGYRGTVRFPTRNVTVDAKFRLRKLKIITRGQRIYSDNFDGFLQTQALSLEEFECDLSLRDSNLHIIFNQFKRLKKFIQKTNEENVLIRNSRVIWRTLNFVTYYEDMNVDGVRLNRVLNSFPNLSSLKCSFLNESDGNYYMLTDLDADKVNVANIRRSEFKNINNVTVGKFTEIENDGLWMRFANSIKNVRNLTIKGVENAEIIPLMMKSLLIFKNIQKFSFRYNPGINRRFVMEDNETVPTGYKFFKILIDTTQKTVKVSSYIVKKFKEILGLLIVVFKDFEFFEFCFNVIAIEKLNIEDHKMDVRVLFAKKEVNPRSQRRSLRHLAVKNYKESKRN